MKILTIYQQSTINTIKALLKPSYVYIFNSNLDKLFCDILVKMKKNKLLQGSRYKGVRY